MISIIIPIYNQTEKLDKCLNSIRNQSYHNFEIILVNDRSTQSMSKVLNRYQKIFGDKLKIFHNQANHGAPYSRNKGFRFSSGEYVIFCDADVIMNPNMLDVMLTTLQGNPSASYAYSSHKFGNKTFKLWPFSAEKLKEMPYIHTTSLIRRKDFTKKGWDENLKRLQDWDLWLTMLEEGHVGIWINQILFKVETGGTMSSWLPSFFYKFFPNNEKVKKYNEAVKIIKNKHNLN